MANDSSSSNEEQIYNTLDEIDNAIIGISGDLNKLKTEVYSLTILTGKKHLQIKLQKSMNMDIWVVGTPNQLFRRGSYTETKFSKKKSSYW